MIAARYFKYRNDNARSHIIKGPTLKATAAARNIIEVYLNEAVDMNRSQ